MVFLFQPGVKLVQLPALQTGEEFGALEDCSGQAVYGGILERGNHRELMALGGEYTTTYVLQSATGADKENSYVVAA